jgi:hypothetical protein
MFRTALCGIIASGLAQKAISANLVQNGGFTSTGGADPTAGQIGFNATVSSWTSGGYNFVFAGGTSAATLNNAEVVGAPTQFGNFLGFYGPLNTPTPTLNGFTTSPAGPNFVALDSYLAPGAGVSVGPLQQTITGLTPGQNYVLSFWFAGAQQLTYNGATTDQLAVSLGGQTDNTPVISVANNGFSGWNLEQLSYTATSSSEVLSFLASGTPPVTDPPFSLIDGIDLEQSAPDTTSTVLLFGFTAAAMAFAARRYGRQECRQ